MLILKCTADLTESAILSNKICKTLGKNPPNGLPMNFFRRKGEKFLNQNGISIDQWLNMLHQRACLFSNPNPKRAKKLYAEVVPKTVDEYLSAIEKYPSQKEKDQISNPVWHVHNGKPPTEKIVMPFSMLLNLVGSSNADNKEILWKFINRFHQELDLKIIQF